MEILKGIRIVDLALIVNNSLIIADTHIGYEEALNKQGVLIPKFQFADVIHRLERIIGGRKFDRIIINGDIKHEFGIISNAEWRNTLGLLDFLGKHCNKIILIKGNHDTILGTVAGKRGISILDSYAMGDVLVIHGDNIPNKETFKEIKTIIIGHEHPAISLKNGLRVERFKCFLKGKYKGKNLIVQPSFNLVHEGTDLSKETLLSPFLHQDLSGFEAYVVADKAYFFGKLSTILQ